MSPMATSEKRRSDREKSRAYRARMRAKGYRLAQRWVLDVNSPEVIAEIRRQIRGLKGGADEQVVVDWCEAAAGETEGWSY